MFLVMKKVYLALWMMVAALSVKSQEFYKTLDTTAYYEFRVNYWFNMHNFLWNEAFLQVNEDSTLLDAAIPKKDLRQIQQTVDYYKTELVNKDLRTDDYMKAFKEWITALEELPPTIPEKFRPHIAHLIGIDRVYKNYLWPD